MMENMVGEFARTAQDDRRAMAERDARLAEAERTRGTGMVGGRMHPQRAAIAKALIALATLLAPPIPDSAPQPGTMTDPTS